MTSPPTLDSVLSNDGFWPDIPVRAFVDGYGLAGSAKNDMLSAALLQAIVDTNDALGEARSQAVADGYATLALWAGTRPGDIVNGTSAVEVLYLSAVYNLAKAKTVKRQQNINRRPVPETETLASDNTEDFFLDEHQNAVARLLNRMAPGTPNHTNFRFYVASIGD